MKKYILFATCAVALSCSTKEDPKPAPAPVAAVQPKVAYHKEVRLYNQYVTDIATKNFYRLKDSTFTNDPKADFDFCYLSLLLAGKNSYILGSPADAIYTQNPSAFPNTKGGSTNFTSYYQLPIEFTYANFDTLVVSSGLKNYIDTKGIIKLSDKNYQLAQALLCEDNFGWSSNTVYGFKTSKGKYGMIKFITSPSGTANNTDLSKKPGVAIIDIKVEK